MFLKNLCLAIAGVLIAQTGIAAELQPAYRFSGTNKTTVVPFELSKGVIFFQVRIVGQSDPLWFSMDSGAGSSYLDEAAARQLNLQPRGQGTVAGSGSERIPVKYVDGVDFQLGELTSFRHNLNVADLSSLAAGFGRPLAGFLGYDFLSRYLVTIDYAALRLTISDPDSTYTGHGTALPVTFKGKWPFVAGSIRVPGGAAEQTEFLVDTGSGDAVDHPAIKSSQGSVRKVRTGVGLGAGEAEGIIGFATFLQLGPYRLKEPLTACCGPNPDTNKLLGGEVLRRFTLTFDYARQQIFLEPNVNFDEPFPDA